MGMGLGVGLSKLINISVLSQLLPACLGLSVVSVAASYASANVIDELYLNNQRAKLAFDHYFESGGEIGSCR